MLPRLPRRALWSLLGAAGLGGCGGDRSGPSSSELRALIESHCELVEQCRCEAALTPETCDDRLADRWNERVRKGDARGLRYDAECFAALVDDVDRLGCFHTVGDEPMCARYCAIYYGTKQLGDACEAIDELVSDCAQGLACHEGRCVEPCAAIGGRQEGEACADPDGGLGMFDDCAQGLACSWSTGTCEALAAEGHSCFALECAEGLSCSWQTETCIPRATEGHSCSFSECAEGLSCGSQTETCVPLATEGHSCEDRSCAEDLYCDFLPEGRRCRSYVAEGGSCANDRCEDELFCNESSRCQAPPGEGEPCLLGSICEQGLQCDFEADRCAEPPPIGAACVQGECALGAWCETSAEDPVGTCVAPVPLGEMCSGHRQCSSGFCPNGFCWARPGLDESCAEAQVCAPGLVCSGTTCEPTLTRAPAACSYPGW
ncbi:MAG: hypothetical protein KC501_25420 [Myxococcales bacterium]|nr:hypothetical protein [Myxococcales bacterium]